MPGRGNACSQRDTRTDSANLSFIRATKPFVSYTTTQILSPQRCMPTRLIHNAGNHFLPLTESIPAYGGGGESISPGVGSSFPAEELDDWRRMALGLKAVSRLMPLCFFSPSMVARSSASSVSCKEREAMSRGPRGTPFRESSPWPRPWRSSAAADWSCWTGSAQMPRRHGPEKRKRQSMRQPSWMGGFFITHAMGAHKKGQA